MISRILARSVAVLLAAATPALASTNNPPTDWGRGVHVFGGVLIDFGAKVFSAGIFGSDLSDCSNKNFYCFSSSLASLVVPKVCQDMRQGAQWTINSITTKVVAVSEEPQGHLTVPGRYWYYLINSGNPNTVFIYSKENGVQALLFDPIHNIDFASLADKNELVSFSRRGQQGEMPEATYWRSQITRDSLAGCRPPAG